MWGEVSYSETSVAMIHVFNPYQTLPLWYRSQATSQQTVTDSDTPAASERLISVSNIRTPAGPRYAAPSASSIRGQALTWLLAGNIPSPVHEVQENGAAPRRNQPFFPKSSAGLPHRAPLRHYQASLGRTLTEYELTSSSAVPDEDPCPVFLGLTLTPTPLLQVRAPSIRIAIRRGPYPESSTHENVQTSPSCRQK